MTLQSPSQPYDWTFRRVVWATLVLAHGHPWILASLPVLPGRFHFVHCHRDGHSHQTGRILVKSTGTPRVAGIILVFLLLLSLLAGFLLLLFPLIVEQGGTIADALPGHYQTLRLWMFTSSIPLIDRLGEFLPATLPACASLVQPTGQEVMDSAGQALGYVTLAARAFLIAIVTLVLVFYWTLDGPRTIQSLLLLIPQDRRENISELISAMEEKLGYYIAGQSVLCLVIGVMALIAYLLIGLPNALVLALLAGVLEAVPMVGPLLGAIPAALVAISIGPDKLIWVIVATVVIQQLENNLLVPRVMRKAVGVNPFVTLLAIFAFSSFFGIAGALMAIPMAAIIQLVLNRFVFYSKTMEPEISAGRDYASRLRYEAQDLAQDLRKQARLMKEGTDQSVKQIDQVMDEIETITTDLDALLAQVSAQDET